jgi:hypothetical protein
VRPITTERLPIEKAIGRGVRPLVPRVQREARPKGHTLDASSVSQRGALPSPVWLLRVNVHLHNLGKFDRILHAQFDCPTNLPGS